VRTFVAYRPSISLRVTPWQDTAKQNEQDERIELITRHPVVQMEESANGIPDASSYSSCIPSASRGSPATMRIRLALYFEFLKQQLVQGDRAGAAND
jgi:hypothetical protein